MLPYQDYLSLIKKAEKAKKPKKVYAYIGGKRRAWYPKPKDLKIPEGSRWCQSKGELVICKRLKKG